MLQMIQIDENEKKNVATSMQNNDGKNEGNNLTIKDENMGKTIENQKKSLPKIKTHMNQTKSYFHTTTSINNINLEEDNTIKNDKETDELNTQPKITKIYRLNKDN